MSRPQFARGVERGMTGIGVLILFIALVLVAAIAAGLILDTAGFLQHTAQDTGEQSTSEVSDRLTVLSTSGAVEAVDNSPLVLSESVDEQDETDYSTAEFDVEDGERADGVELREWTVGDDVDITVELYDEDDAVVEDSVTFEAEAGTTENYIAPFDTEDLDDDTTYSVDITTSAMTDFDGEVDVRATDGEVSRVTELRLAVYRSPGADSIDLQQASIEMFGPSGTALLIHEEEYNSLGAERRNEDFAENLGMFDVKAVKDSDASVPVLNAKSDRALINIELHNWTQSGHYANADVAPPQMQYFGDRDSVTLRITTPSGATTTDIVNVPASLAGDEGSTVLL